MKRNQCELKTDEGNPCTYTDILNMVRHTAYVSQVKPDIIWLKCYEGFNKATGIDLNSIYRYWHGKKSKLQIVSDQHKVYEMFIVAKDVCENFLVLYKQRKPI